MALGTERLRPAVRIGTAGEQFMQRAKQAAERFSDWFFELPVMRVIAGSLLRRILISNLTGFAIFLVGVLHVNQNHAWLIEAKRDSLRAQGEIIAAAIAANATMDGDQIVLDPRRLPEPQDLNFPLRDDAFTALELPIRPETVTPVLRKLLQSPDIRARIYGPDGTLAMDSEMMPQRGEIQHPSLLDPHFRVTDFSTWLQSWSIDRSLPVYKDIGDMRGTAYPEVAAALGGTATPMLLLSEKGEQIVAMAVPIRRLRSVYGVLLLSTRPGEIDAILGEERAAVLGIAMIALTVSLLTAFLLSRTVTGPIRQLTIAAEKVSDDPGNATLKSLPLYRKRSDEVGRMATAFHAMAHALWMRVEASEKFAADVAHELRNPLTAARTLAESISYAQSERDKRRFLVQLKNELQRLGRLITDIAAASRLDAELARQNTQILNVTATVSAVRDLFRDGLAKTSRKIALVTDPVTCSGAYLVRGNDSRLIQVLTNLVDNALSFSPPGGTVTIHTRHLGAKVIIQVDDEGPGIPPEHMERVFERFYSERPAFAASGGKNSGLGLSISREIVLAHGGRIWAENRYPPGTVGGSGTPVGARFVVELPAVHVAPV